MDNKYGFVRTTPKNLMTFYLNDIYKCHMLSISLSLKPKNPSITIPNSYSFINDKSNIIKFIEPVFMRQTSPLKILNIQLTLLFPTNIEVNSYFIKGYLKIENIGQFDGFSLDLDIKRKKKDKNEEFELYKLDFIKRNLYNHIFPKSNNKNNEIFFCNEADSISIDELSNSLLEKNKKMINDLRMAKKEKNFLIRIIRDLLSEIKKKIEPLKSNNKQESFAIVQYKEKDFQINHFYKKRNEKNWEISTKNEKNKTVENKEKLIEKEVISNFSFSQKKINEIENVNFQITPIPKDQNNYIKLIEEHKKLKKEFLKVKNEIIQSKNKKNERNKQLFELNSNENNMHKAHSKLKKDIIISTTDLPMKTLIDESTENDSNCCIKHQLTENEIKAIIHNLDQQFFVCSIFNLNIIRNAIIESKGNYNKIKKILFV